MNGTEQILVEEIKLTNLLSFGPNTRSLPLRALNVLIGANGSGKSNLIEAISLLQSAPRLLASPVRDGGGIHDWLWKGETNPTAALEVVVRYPRGKQPLRHRIRFIESGQRFELRDEEIGSNEPFYDYQDQAHLYFGYRNGQPRLSVAGKERRLQREDINPEESILSQRRDPDQYPEITHLAREYERIRIYREWSFGRYTPSRQPQKADQRNDFLMEDCTNLGLVLNKLRREPDVKSAILKRLSDLYSDINDFDVQIEGGTVQVFLQEDRFAIPATRLSDGTLRYLCLLAILLHPTPPPLICIEEPELGLHPDVIVGIAELLKDASTRTQLIVTTHSQVLVDALSETPDDVIVCEKVKGATILRRLDVKQLTEWLKSYSLGELWRSGEIGGNRW
jgi:predicted ATPase